MRWDDPLTQWDLFSWDSPDAPVPPPILKPRKPNRKTMASNPTPENPDVLRALADRLADGDHQHEVALGVKLNVEAAIRADIAAVSNAETDVGVKKLALSDAYAALQVADDAGFATLTDCKLRLAQKYGQRWSPSWEPTGFPDQSTAVPTTMGPRFTLLDALKNYFTLKPADESVDMGATAAVCLARWTAISDANHVVANAESAQTTAFATRTAAIDALRKRVRGLIRELGQLMSETDPRWEDFGLNIPASPTAPEGVASVTAHALGNGRLDVTFPYATRATRFRVEVFITGVDTEWHPGKTIKDLEVNLPGFTAGQVVKVRVISANDGGDAPPSPETQVTVT
jgi:hypothetical protein